MAKSVRSQVVATVWRVEVSAGDRVEPGAVLLVLESMKMEVPVVAETVGAVTPLRVAEGDLLATMG